MTSYAFKDIVIGEEGLLKGPFGSDLKKDLYVPKGEDTYKVYLQENILKEKNDVGLHYISKEYYEEKMSRYAVKEGDFIVTCDGTLGEIFQLNNITEPGIISSSLLRITLNNDIVDDNYFYYLFKAIIKKQLITQGNNSVLKHLPGLGVIREHIIELPDLETQKKVGDVLHKIDCKIRNNRRINQKLEQLSLQIYNYWFLQLEFPNEKGMPYQSSGGRTIWNNEINRAIPIGWEVKRLNELVKTVDNRGKNPPYEDMVTSHPVIDVATLRNEGRALDYTECSKYVSDDTYDGWFRAGHPQKGDILFSTVGSLAETKLYYPNEKIKGTIAQNVIGIRTGETLYSYLYQLINIEKEKIIGYKIGSVQPSLKVGHVLEHKVLLPDEDTLKKYSFLMEDINLEINHNNNENQELLIMRNYLLPLLMNGQITF